MDLEFLHTSLQRQVVCIKCIKSSLCLSVCVCVYTQYCVLGLSLYESYGGQKHGMCT